MVRVVKTALVVTLVVVQSDSMANTAIKVKLNSLEGNVDLFPALSVFVFQPFQTKCRIVTETSVATILVTLGWDTQCKNYDTASKRCALSLPVLNFFASVMPTCTNEHWEARKHPSRPN